MAGKIILFIATSLDGYIARKDGQIDWLFTDQDYGYKEFFSSIDIVVTGRKTFDLAKSFEYLPFGGKKCYVFSRKNAGKVEGNTLFIEEEVSTFIPRIRKEAGKDIWLVGGAELIKDFMEHGLIDEFIISIIPVIIGGGIPLFLPHQGDTKLELVKVQFFDTGLVQLRYNRARK